MPIVNRPSTYPAFMPDYESNPNAVEPASTKKNLGFSREKLPYQWINWLQANQSEWIEYLDSITYQERAFLIDSQGAGQFTTLTDALASLPTGADEPSESKPFYIRIMPGTYDEDIIVPQYVSLLGYDALNCIISGMITLSGYNVINHLTLLQTLPTRTNTRHIVLGGPATIDSCQIKTFVNEAPFTFNGSTFHITVKDGVNTTIKNCSVINEVLQDAPYRNLINSDVKYGDPGESIFQVLNSPVFLLGCSHVTNTDTLIRASGVTATPRISFIFQSSDILPDGVYPSFTKQNTTDIDVYIGLHDENYPGNLSPRPQDVYGEKTFKEDIVFESQPTFFSRMNLDAVSGYLGTYSLGSTEAITGYAGGVLTPGGLVYMCPYSANGVKAAYSPYGRVHNTAAYSYTGSANFIGGVVLPTGFIFLAAYDYASTKFLIDLNTLEPVDGPTYPAGSGKFWGGVLLPNGKVFCIPYNRTVNTSIIFNPFTALWEDINGVGLSLTAGAFRGGVLLPNGKVFCVPFNERTNFIFNPATLSFEAGATAPNQAGEYSHLPNTFEGGVMLPNGKVLCLQGLDSLDGPSPTSWTYDYLTDTWEETLNGESQISYSGGCLLPNGLVVAALKIGDTTRYLYDYRTNSWFDAAQTMDAGHCGAVLLTDGRAAIIPKTGTYVKLFTGPIGTRTAEPWCHHNVFNKF